MVMKTANLLESDDVILDKKKYGSRIGIVKRTQHTWIHRHKYMRIMWASRTHYDNYIPIRTEKVMIDTDKRKFNVITNLY